MNQQFADEGRNIIALVLSSSGMARSCRLQSIDPRLNFSASALERARQNQFLPFASFDGYNFAKRTRCPTGEPLKNEST